MSRFDNDQFRIRSDRHITLDPAKVVVFRGATDISEIVKIPVAQCLLPIAQSQVTSTV